MLNFIKKSIKKFKEKRKFKKALKKLNKGEFLKAKKIMRELLDSDVSEVLDMKMLYFNYGSVLISMEELDEAKKYLIKAIKEDNSVDFFWGTLAEIHILKKEWENAEKNLKKAVKINPENKNYKNKLEIVRGDKKNKENYFKYYELIKEAINLQKKEKWGKSIEKFKESLNYYNKMGYAYNQIGAIYNNNLDKKKKALKYFRLALEKEPNNEMFKTNLKRIR